MDAESVATCTRCGETKPTTAFTKRVDRPSVRSHCRACVVLRRKEWGERPDNRERMTAYRRGRRLAAKVGSLRHYGGVCACCGEADVRLLTFDHIEGGGTEHRRTNQTARNHMGSWLRDSGYPPGYQVLCFNCNSGRSVNGGICPHKDPGGRITCADFS